MALLIHFQARSQDRFWRVRDPQKVDLLDPRSGLFWTSPPNTLLQKPHLWPTLWLKVDLLADFLGGASHPPPPPPPFTGLYIFVKSKLCYLLHGCLFLITYAFHTVRCWKLDLSTWSYGLCTTWVLQVETANRLFWKKHSLQNVELRFMVYHGAIFLTLWFNVILT